ncbi:hypothetical protein CYLTODRAFT_404266 [Cylindrobasidium torrendii FP15055 ss-10]|uniref:Peptidase C14 caspase domain-containing protein n=1 Tax=Cylindrobasidium torrendii FP15055 ss-10 TaxID=1314674 RepID=A0A0D7AZD8_9AGAR|nr:hypothetical protein CYLTODRAFT_404266 [Cylindrobasidium torrendii FP15055 ss-10]
MSTTERQRTLSEGPQPRPKKKKSLFRRARILSAVTSYIYPHHDDQSTIASVHRDEQNRAPLPQQQPSLPPPPPLGHAQSQSHSQPLPVPDEAREIDEPGAAMPRGLFSRNPDQAGPRQQFHHDLRLFDHNVKKFNNGVEQKLRTMFQYSKCTGKKRAVCIGINYVGQKSALKGCVNDARHVREFLMKHWGFHSRDVMILTDTDPDQRRHPTRALILGAMKWLVEGAKCHDSLFFHYSGHGGRRRDTHGDEISGYDETIYPVDYPSSGIIVDDLLHDLLVKPLPMGCRLTALFDCCHSGTVLDLPYSYNGDGSLMKRQVSKKATSRKGSPADVICWSGSQDGQTSADTFVGGVAVGAMSYAFIKCLRANHNQSYQQLLEAVRDILKPRYSQIPQLGSSHPIDTRLEFLI